MQNYNATITTPEPATSCGGIASCTQKIARFARKTIKATLTIWIESNSLIKRIQTIRKYAHIRQEIHKVKNPVSLPQKLKMTLLIKIVFNHRSQNLKCFKTFLPLQIWIILIFWKLIGLLSPDKILQHFTSEFSRLWVLVLTDISNQALLLINISNAMTVFISITITRRTALHHLPSIQWIKIINARKPCCYAHPLPSSSLPGL